VNIIILTKFAKPIFCPSRHGEAEHSELCERSRHAEGREIGE